MAGERRRVCRFCHSSSVCVNYYSVIRGTGWESYGWAGVSVGYTAASVIDFDVDFDYSPDFYADRFSSYVLTTMGNVSFGIPFGPIRAPRFRPCVTGGTPCRFRSLSNS